MRRLFAFLTLAFFGSAASAQVCTDYVGRVVTPKTFEEIAARFASLPVKDEYETTIEYQQRRASLLGEIGSVVIGTPRRDEGPFAFRYDADAEMLSVPAYAFQGNQGFDAFSGLTGTPAVYLSSRANLNAVTANRTIYGRSYMAQNAFGARTRITDEEHRISVIFDGSSRDYRAHLFPNGTFEEAGRIAMRPDEARRLKPLLELAYVVLPQEPYLVQKNYPRGLPTMSDSRRVTVNATVLIADISCALVLEPNGTVRGSFATN